MGSSAIWVILFITPCLDFKRFLVKSIPPRPSGLMDKASDFESEDCGFESHLGHLFYNRQHRLQMIPYLVKSIPAWPSDLMDKMPDMESKDCGVESHVVYSFHNPLH